MNIRKLMVVCAALAGVMNVQLVAASIADSSQIHPTLVKNTLPHNYVVGYGNAIVSGLSTGYAEPLTLPVSLNRNGLCPEGMTLQASVALQSIGNQSVSAKFNVQSSPLQGSAFGCTPRRICIFATGVQALKNNPYQANIQLSGLFRCEAGQGTVPPDVNISYKVFCQSNSLENHNPIQQCYIR